MSNHALPAGEPSDEHLMQRVQRGDLGALGTLYARHHRRVHALCYRLTGDVTAADDLMQDSFLRVMRYGRGFKAEARFGTWLHRLVRNVCFDHMSAAKRERERQRHLALHRDGPDLSDDDERLDLVREALYRLPPEKREVLVLSRYGNLKYKEIAEICQVTVDTVKMRAHRAMRDLRRIFEELEQQA